MIGQTISQYKILEKLGEGGMGVVYKAQDLKLDRIVALKFLPHHISTNEAEKARFLQEAKAAAALNHPNVCSVIDIQEHEREQFIIMEYVDGRTIRKKLESGPIPSSEAISYSIQIGEALQEAHSKGIVHRDIKADNIMVNSKNQIKVMDFGLAKLKGSLKLTRTSSTVGTLAYMPPEQIQGGEVDARSDIFSFGVLLFEMLTGHLPFRGEHETALMYSILNEEPETLQKYLPDTPSELLHISNRSLEKDPENRYQSVHDMLIDLRRLKKDSSRVSRTPLIDQGKSFDQSTPSVSATSTTRIPLSRRILLGASVSAVVIISGASYFLFFSGEKPIDSIAVLPFVNVGADPNTEYLSDGLTENLINNLTKLSRLRVVPRSTVFHYKGQESDPLKVARELNVRSVLTGRLTQRGDNLNIQTELLDVKQESQLWGEQYNRKISDVSTLQQDISKEVVQKLRLQLSGVEERQLAKRSTENSDAYQLYLKGRFYWNKRTGEDLKKAVDFFNQAIELDAAFALAYAGLAQSFVLLPEYAGASPKEFMPKGELAAKRALEIDETLAEAHAVLGLIKEFFQYDWKGAEEEFKRAIEMNPQFPTTYHWYCTCLEFQGRLEEALTQIRIAQRLDPLSLIIGVNVGDVFKYKKQCDRAIEQYNKVLDLDSNFVIGHMALGDCYEQKGMYREALTEYLMVRALVGDIPYGLGRLGHIYAIAGRKTEARRIIDQLVQVAGRGFTVSYDIALVYSGLNDKDRAFEWLEKARAELNPFLIEVKVQPNFDNLRSDPRYEALLKKIGLEK